MTDSPEKFRVGSVVWDPLLLDLMRTFGMRATGSLLGECKKLLGAMNELKRKKQRAERTFCLQSITRFIFPSCFPAVLDLFVSQKQALLERVLMIK